MNMFRLVAIVSILAAVMMGCQPKEEPQPTTGEQSVTSPATTQASGDGGGITPIGGVGAGPMTPVAGTESLQGGGSAAGQVAKDRARGIAGSSPSSINQMTEDGN